MIYLAHAVDGAKMKDAFARIPPEAMCDIICRKVSRANSWEQIDTFNKRKMFRIYLTALERFHMVHDFLGQPAPIEALLLAGKHREQEPDPGIAGRENDIVQIDGNNLRVAAEVIPDPNRFATVHGAQQILSDVEPTG